MKGGIGIFLWKISVALYLFANGVLGLQGKFMNKGDFYTIFKRMDFKGDTLAAFVTIASVIAIIAGVCILLEMFEVQVPVLDTLILIIAIVWVVYVVIEVIGWVTGKAKSENTFSVLQMLAVHTMVLSSLLIASKKFG